jgi:glutathione synthase/RimK-type ligase-like ATP-grasp enzyme
VASSGANMADGQKISTTELLYKSAMRMGLEPSWVIPNGLFAVQIHGSERYINSANSPLNSHVSVSLTRNKHLTRMILQRHGLRNIPFMRPENHEQAASFLQVHEKIIAKPVAGFGSQDIHIVTSNDQLQPLDIANYILELYIPGVEMRYLVLNDTVIGVQESEYGTSVQADRSLKRISFASDDWDQDMVATSKQIVRVMGLKFAAVDYMIDKAGNAYILEVNSAPGLRWFHTPSSGPSIDAAGLFLEAMVKERTQ